LRLAAEGNEPRRAETVRKVAELALDDAVQITLLIALLKGQSTEGVSERIKDAGATKAVAAFRNALIARLVILIARAYATPKQGDLHLRVAANILEDNRIRQVFSSGDDSAKLAAFDEHWAKCRGDHRLPAIKAFRDKYTAHLGEPKDIDQATFGDLLAFGAETAKAMELLALAARVAVNPISTDAELASSPEAFWGPWKAEGEAKREGTKRA
jgi:AbiU2